MVSPIKRLISTRMRTTTNVDLHELHKHRKKFLQHRSKGRSIVNQFQLFQYAMIPGYSINTSA